MLQKNPATLGHIVSERGMEVDPNKIKAIQEMPVLKIEKDVQGFIGKLQYISRFIAKLTMVCDPIFKLLRKNQPVEWNEECQKALEKIKEYLTSPPFLKPPRQGKPLILYLALEENVMGAMLTQEGLEGIEHAVSYLSKKFLPYEEKYDLVEKTCLIMIWATRKLTYYFQSYKIQAVSKIDPLRYLFQVPALIGKMSWWLVLI